MKPPKKSPKQVNTVEMKTYPSRFNWLVSPFIAEYYLKNAFPVYVGNLPTNVKKKRILKMFQPCGKILALRLRTNIGKNFMKREQIKKVPFLVAFVYFATEKAAEDSLKLTGEKIGDNVIYVDRDLDKKDEKSKVNAKTTIFIGNLKYRQYIQIIYILREMFLWLSFFFVFPILQQKPRMLTFKIRSNVAEKLNTFELSNANWDATARRTFASRNQSQSIWR